MALPERIHEYRNHHLDSTRWDHFNFRDDDIVVTTAYKAGTTWTQRILAALIHGPASSADLRALSPWIDARFMGPIEPLIEAVDAQTHRRFVKSHLAADGIRFVPEAKYVVVGRDTRDVFMSMWNHYTAYTDLAFSLFNDADRPGPELPRPPGTPRDMWPRWISEGWFDWESDGWPFWSHHHHLSTWWDARDQPNVHFMHFGDMLGDTEREMRRLAAFCEIDVPEANWPAIVDVVQLEAMRNQAKGDDGRADESAMIFEGGIDRFLFKGTNGRWRDVLTDDDLVLYDKAVAQLDPSLRAWLEGGRTRVSA